LSLTRERGSRYPEALTGNLKEILEPFRAIEGQNFKTTLGDPVGSIGETRLARVIGENQGFESEKGQRPCDGPDIVGIADPVQNKMHGA
jgi:hypothetical protein